MKLTKLVLSVLVVASAADAQTVGSFLSTGQGCPGSSLLYEQFPVGSFDLSGFALEWIPNGSEGYVVVPSGTPMLPYGSGFDLTLGDDQVSGPHNLGFSHPHPRGLGSTTQIDVSSNGYVYLEPSTIPTSRSLFLVGSTNFVLQSFRNETPSWALFGSDLDPSTGGHVWFDTAPGVAYVTWDQVPEEGTSSVNTCQIHLYLDGRVVTAWGTAANTAHTALVGWSGGGGVEDFGSTDISASLPIDMGGSSGPLTISAPVGRLPTTGSTFTIDVDNVPSDGIVGALLLGAFPVQFDLDVLGMPNCDLLTAADIGSVPLVLTAPTGSVSLTFPTTPGTAGLTVETRGAVIAASVNTFGLGLSNRGTLTIGDTQAVIARASGPDCENDDTTSGFWSIVNGTQLGITSVSISWVGSSVPNSYYFHASQGNMANRFSDGAVVPPNACTGTYRNGTEMATGLVFTNTLTAQCGGGMTGWTGAVLLGPWKYRTINFTFSNFDPEEVFEVDIDVDARTGGAPIAGGAMAGLVVTVGMSDGSMRSGELVMVDMLNARAIL